MNIRQINEALSELQKNEIVRVESLDDIIIYGADKLSDLDDVDELVYTIFDDIYDDSRIVRLWIDIQGDTKNKNQIVSLMENDLRSYIPEEIVNYKNLNTH